MVLSIPYMEPVIYREPVPDFGAGTARKQTINTRTYQVAQVPHKILLFARPRGQFTDDLSPEAFLTINKIQIRTASCECNKCSVVPNFATKRSEYDLSEIRSRYWVDCCA
jgi:hypothetical protein